MPRGYTEEELTQEEAESKIIELKLRILSERITDLSGQLSQALSLIDALTKRVNILEYSNNFNSERMNRGHNE